MQRAHYFGIKNKVHVLDLDIIPQGFDPAGYLQMFRANGMGRVAKTIGRKAILGKSYRQAWQKTIGASNLKEPTFIHGDICQDTPQTDYYDLAMSWSVFEHLLDPRSALQNLINSLRSDGGFYISLHLWTSNNGHHDIRAFTGDEEKLPLWGHLRPTTRGNIVPSSWLNEWRLSQWRELMDELAPGAEEFLEQYEYPEVYGPKLVGELQQELADYSEDELLTVNVVYMWQKA